jgi:hypothetical protein
MVMNAFVWIALGLIGVFIAGLVMKKRGEGLVRDIVRK